MQRSSVPPPAVASATKVVDTPTPPDGEPASSPKRNAAATRLRILDAGEHEFAARGFAGARLREIGDTAGVQPALIHHYFTDKQGLYRAVLDRALEPTSTESWTLLSTRNGLEDLLAGFIELLLRFYAANMNLISILRHEAVAESRVLADLTRQRTLPVIEALLAVVEERQAAGEVRRDVPAHEIILAGMSMIAYPFVEEGMLSVALPAAVARDEESLARRKEAVLKLLLASLRPEPTSKRELAAIPSRTRPAARATAKRPRAKKG